MTTIRTVSDSTTAVTQVNDNFKAVSAAGLYGYNAFTTTGLYFGYYGGQFNGVTVTDSAVLTTTATTNYIVAHRTTGVVTSATTTTNWNNTTTYMRLYAVLSGATTITSFVDHRQAFGEVAAGALTNPMTTAEDLIKGGGSGTPARLAVGTNGQVLSVTAGVVGWATVAGTGDVVGPASATADAIALFNGTTGKLIKDSTETIATLRSIPQNSQSTAYTLVLADAGKHILHPSADTTARVITIPANSSVAFPVGTAVTFVNQNAAGVVTIAITTDTMRLAGAGTTGSRTLAANGTATALKITSTEWIISGVGLT